MRGSTASCYLLWYLCFIIWALMQDAIQQVPSAVLSVSGSKSHELKIFRLKKHILLFSSNIYPLENRPWPSAGLRSKPKDEGEPWVRRQPEEMLGLSDRQTEAATEIEKREIEYRCICNGRAKMESLSSGPASQSLLPAVPVYKAASCDTIRHLLFLSQTTTEKAHLYFPPCGGGTGGPELFLQCKE